MFRLVLLVGLLGVASAAETLATIQEAVRDAGDKQCQKLSTSCRTTYTPQNSGNDPQLVIDKCETLMQKCKMEVGVCIQQIDFCAMFIGELTKEALTTCKNGGMKCLAKSKATVLTNAPAAPGDKNQERYNRFRRTLRHLRY
ncbi:unnamed protein product, partial [Mesorhabditis spiculigera]